MQGCLLKKFNGIAGLISYTYAARCLHINMETIVDP